MKITENKTIRYEEKLIHGGSLAVRMEQEGTVDINGYCYRSDVKTPKAQIEFMQDFVKKITVLVDEIASGTVVKVDKRKEIVKLVIRESSRLGLFGGIGVLAGQVILHDVALGLIVGVITLVSAMLIKR